ncbi:ABC transporter substrate-binding protein [Clostridium sp. CS001]|uniref:ABC transporter substrate-binding protein n=1 Tax=Clostridium sp. CS001 TaxID=2880648 RepID=UPI001CF4576C|nr:ABC transporter substrate-binding protein [Clostridium sp. CS001]MCB2289688.1 ABC transporter substrate-binding protein [Clostridium sp. CS001]
MIKNKAKKFTMVAIVSIFSVAFIMGGCGKKQEVATKKDTTQEVKEQSWDKVKQKGELTVGLCAEFAPFESRNEKTGEIEGFDVDMAKSLGEELGVKIKIVDAQWEALVGGVEKGDYDVLITCMSKKEAAQGNINMTDVYYNLNDVIVVNKDNNSINSADDLKGKVVGVQAASSSEQAVDALKELKEVKRYNRNPEAFIDLQNKRIEAVVVGYAYAATQMKQAKDIKIIDKPIATQEIVMVLKKGNDSLTTKLNEGLGTIKKNGKYDKVITKWLKLN